MPFQNNRTFPLFVVLSALLLLASTLATALASAQATVLGELEIPELSLQADIVPVPLGYPTWDTSQLGTQVGHLEGTAWVGQDGNIVLAGHSTDIALQPSIFYELDALEAGDEILLTVDGMEHRYRVTDTYNVDITDLSPLRRRRTNTLTLMTCTVTSYDAGSNSYTQRQIVVAEEVL